MQESSGKVRRRMAKAVESHNCQGVLNLGENGNGGSPRFANQPSLAPARRQAGNGLGGEFLSDWNCSLTASFYPRGMCKFTGRLSECKG